MFNSLNDSGSKIKKVLILVKCPNCKRGYYINALELVKIPFAQNENYKNECRLCGKSVKLERV